MSDKNVSKQSEIKIRVGLNKDNLPVELDWLSEEGENANTWNPVKALMVSLFDDETRDTLRIDLWTTEFQVIEMDRFMYQSLRSMADTYYRATQNKELANEMQRFVQYFGEKTEVIPKNS
ncbi:MAG: gliding motility protein GldC [Saprospiraceae bacterium]|nr:gliding motility protein GldC [Saprospiraceae bacterium]